MLGDALDKKYKGPFEGIMGIFNNAMDYGVYLMNGTVIGIILIGRHPDRHHRGYDCEAVRLTDRDALFSIRSNGL